MCDGPFYYGGKHLKVLTFPTASTQATTFQILEFSTDTNGVRGEFIGHSKSGDGNIWPSEALICHVLHLLKYGAYTIILLYYYFGHGV